MPDRAPPRFRPVPYAYHQELDVRIENLTNEGVGVARVDGWVVFVPFALPGERVICRVFRNHKNYSEADLARVLEPSPHRRKPMCPVFGQCGGCQYQNLEYEEQLRWKRNQLTELLARMARINHPVEPVIPSPRQMAYRSKITPHYQRPKDGAIGAIGFLRAGTRSAIVDVPQCPIAMPELNEKLAELRQHLRAAPAATKNGATLLLRAAGGEVLTRPSDIAVESVLGLTLEFQAGDFFQNNPFMLPAFVEHVIGEARNSGATALVDAYCGSGLFALCASRHFESAAGVEISASAILKARHNADANDIRNCEFLAADAQHIFSGITFPAANTVVIVDPPRAGCGREFLDQLFAFGPRAVIYVSCNPATQMRDLEHFIENQYALRRVQPFDLFPQTRHLECVATLERVDSRA